MTTTRRLLLGATVAALLALSSAAVEAAFTALCGTGVSCAYQAGDKFGYQTVEKIRQNFNALVAAPYITKTADSNLTGEFAMSSLATGLVKNTTTTGVPSIASAGTDYVSPSSTETLTNKTLNAEGTGNVLTVVEKKDFPTALCTGAGAYEEGGWSYAAGGNPDAATNACHFGTNTIFGSVEFLDSSTAYYHNKLWLPSDWTGAVDVRLAWNTAATTGNAKWQIQTTCVAAGETLDPAWNTASTVTQAAQGTTLLMSVASMTGITTTGCAAGELMFFRVLRNPADAADTLGASAFLVEVELTYRRAM